MKRGKVGLATVFTGLNFGSALQAFAMKTFLCEMGFDATLFKLKGSIIANRDVRLSKLLMISLRSLVHSSGMKEIVNYYRSLSRPVSETTKRLFNDFCFSCLNPEMITYRDLKKTACKSEYVAFLCGSDQIWNSTTMYVDPFYYLRFSPSEKRIAYAPSFGRDFIPRYNRSKLARYIKDIRFISIRESTGADLIKELIGIDTEVLIDPTFLLSAEEWAHKLSLDREVESPRYLLAYFLDRPSAQTVNLIQQICQQYNLKIVGIPHLFEELEWEGDVVDAGPREFVRYVKNASFICTDSFHGVAFSLIFNVPFFVFERAYGLAANQSSRLISVLNLFEKKDRYEPKTATNAFEIDFSYVNEVMVEERRKSVRYLTRGLDSIEAGESLYE